MQCTSCRFENMPQMTQCARCGAALAGDDAVAVTPPRAGNWEKRFRLATLIRFVNNQFESLGRFGRLLRLDGVAAVTFRTCNIRTASLFWRAAIPGLPQLYLGRNQHARIFFFGYVAALLVTILTLGTTLSSIAIGLVVSFHLMSIIDVAWTTCDDRSDRLALLSVMVIGACLLFYLPTSAIVWNRLGVQSVVGNIGPLRGGDSLLFRRSFATFTPQVGELVLYNAPLYRYNTAGAINMFGGATFERVIAVAGQEVAWRGGKLFVDGVISEARPLGNPTGTVPDIQFTVPDGCCYIAPMAMLQAPGYAVGWFGLTYVNAGRGLRMPTDSTTWQHIGTVRHESIYGVVWSVRRGLFSFVSTQPNRGYRDDVPVDVPVAAPDVALDDVVGSSSVAADDDSGKAGSATTSEKTRRSSERRSNVVVGDTVRISDGLRRIHSVILTAFGSVPSSSISHSSTQSPAVPSWPALGSK